MESWWLTKSGARYERLSVGFWQRLAFGRSGAGELDLTCDGAGNCSSYYGPSPGSAVGGALKEAYITSAVYAAQTRPYTLDHRPLRGLY